MTGTTAPCTFSSRRISWAYGYPVDSYLAGLKLRSEFLRSSQVKLVLVVYTPTLSKEDVSTQTLCLYLVEIWWWMTPC